MPTIEERITVMEKAKARCEKGIHLNCKHIIALGIGLYIFAFIVTYGIIAASFDRDYDACVKADSSPANKSLCSFENAGPSADLGPVFGGVLWPIYWPLHLSRLAFR